MSHNVGGVAPSKILAGTTPVTKVMIGSTQVWPDAPPTEVPQELYAVEQVNQSDRVVAFTALKGFVPVGDALEDEMFMFRCVQQSGLNGYVGRTFSKSFAGSSYAEYDCHLEDQYGDGTPTPDMRKAITFKVRPKLDTKTTRQAGAIKGNADSGLYHMPDDPHYDQTIAEATFDTEADAQAGGYVKYVRKSGKKKT